VYNPAHYDGSDVGVHDYKLDSFKCPSLSNVIGDLMSGHQAAADAKTFRHFAALLEETAPDVIQLEQPFMWPLAKKLRQMSGRRKPVLIYSSQNIEAPLKRMVLASSGASSEERNRLCSEIDEMEAELTREADLIICVSHSDREFYLSHFRASAQTLIVPNGVQRVVNSESHRVPDGLSSFEGRRFLMTVSSSHVPTIDGLCHYVVRGGIFCAPPVPSIAICGSIAASVAENQEYQRYVVANRKRVQFFFDVSDSELLAIKRCCHGVFLPIRSGGGTNLKTAEALVVGKWIIATTTALRGFERFMRAEGVILADSPAEFRQAMREVLQRPPLEISERSQAARDALFWDRCFADSALPTFLQSLG